MTPASPVLDRRVRIMPRRNTLATSIKARRSDVRRGKSALFCGHAERCDILCRSSCANPTRSLAMRYLRTSKPPSAITDESVYLARREWIRKVAMATPALLAGCDDGTSAEDASVIESPGMRRLATAERTRDAVGEVRTRERDATQYNNFYEF